MNKLKKLIYVTPNARIAAYTTSAALLSQKKAIVQPKPQPKPMVTDFAL